MSIVLAKMDDRAHEVSADLNYSCLLEKDFLRILRVVPEKTKIVMAIMRKRAEMTRAIGESIKIVWLISS